MAIAREVKEGLLPQGVDERVVYKLDTTPWGSAPTAVQVKAYDEMIAFSDVSATVLTGSPTVLVNLITCPTLFNLVQDHIYRLEIKFTTGDNTYEAFARIAAER